MSKWIIDQKLFFRTKTYALSLIQVIRVSVECHWLISKDAAKYLSDHSEAFLFISIMPSVKLDHQHQWYDDQLKIIWVLISKDAAKYPLITPPAFRPWASAWCQVQSLALASNIMKHQKLKKWLYIGAFGDLLLQMLNLPTSKIFIRNE